MCRVMVADERFPEVFLRRIKPLRLRVVEGFGQLMKMGVDG